MKLELDFQLGKVYGNLDGNPFTIVQDGCVTTFSDNHPFTGSDDVFANMLASKILSFTMPVMKALDTMDECDEFRIWEKLSSDVADVVYDELAP